MLNVDVTAHARIQKVLSEGSNTDVFFFSWWDGEMIEMPLKGGPSSARGRMAFRWRADNGPPLNAGLVAFAIFIGSGSILLGSPILLCFFRRGPDPLPPPLLWIRPCNCRKYTKYETCAKCTKCTGFIATVHLKIFPIIYDKWRPNDWVYLSFYLSRGLSYAYLGC